MKRLTRFLACFLAAVLVFSNLQYVGVKAVEVEEVTVDAESAEATAEDDTPAESAVSENTLTLTFNDLVDPFGYGYGDAVEVDKKTGAATIKFNNDGGYGEVRYNLPDEIDTSKVSKVEILFEEGSAGVFLKVFLLKDAKGYEQDKWGNAADAMLNYTPAVEPEYQFKSIGLCSPDAQNDVVLKGIKITYGDVEKPVKEPPKAPETKPTVKAYTADDLTFSWADPNGEGVYEKKDGKWVVNFTEKQYAQVAFNLPEATELSQLASVKFTVADQTVPVSFKLLSGGKEVESETVYGQSGKTEYVITPKRDDSASIDGIGVMVTDAPKEGDTVSIVGVEFTVDPAIGGDEPPVTYGDNIIKNPNFAEEDLSVWSMGVGESKIKVASQEEAIFDDVKTYGVIDRDAAYVNEDGTQDARHHFFAQDVTKAIEAGGDLNRKPKYKVEFWAKLSDDYKDAPANQRVVEFAPYIVTEQDGTVYLGASYSQQLSGNLSQTLTVGEWTKYSGTFEVTHNGTIKQVVIRIIEQGTEYGDISKGSCVKGDFYIAGVTMAEVMEPETTIEEDIPNWKDAITGAFGNDAVAGTCLGSGTITMEHLQALAKKHFNAITFENEMKPDITLGSTPTLDEKGELVYNFAVADRMMAQIKEWNDASADDDINFKIRGHVLVWHSQTPEWFFHEDYDTSKGFVTPEVMNARMEHYIKAVFEHYKSVKFEDGTTAADMFYGWDVVNEAMSDSTGKPRKASDQSNWARVYGDESNEYIINAFRYANKYAPANIRLYYNDYNDSNEPKATGIAELLAAITAAEKDAVNPTRIDGMGMQAHHNYSDPTAKQIKSAINKYLTALGEGGIVEMTEFDVKASSTFDGSSAESVKSEHAKQAWRFKEIFEAYKEIETEKPGSVGGITMWGVVDERSWLQDSNSVGGASSGGTHAPLLFYTENYVSKAKPAFWAFVDQDKLEPYINEVNAMNTDKLEYASENEAKAGDITFKYKTYWSAGKLNFWVDDSLSGKEVVLYTDLAADGTPDTPVPFENGMASINIADIDVNQTYLFDIVVGGKAYNDTKGTFTETSDYYAKVTTKPLMLITKGTAYVDGNSADWEDVKPVTLGAFLNDPGASAEAKVCWDEENLYVLMDVKDTVLDATGSGDHEKDSMELFIDELNEKAGGYDDNDKQYRVNYLNEQTFNNAGGYCAADYIDSAVKVVEGKGYVIEAAIEWTKLEAKPGELIGLDLQINNAENGGRVGTANWYDTSGYGYQNSGLFGTGVLVDAEKVSDDAAVKAKVEAAEKAIDEIGTVAYTEASKAKIDAAAEAYADMTVAQRLAVENKTTFVAAVKSYKKLDDEVKAAEKAIAAIGNVAYSEASLKAINAAKEACKDLTDDQKAAMKSALDSLAKAEKDYEAAKAEYLANEENKKNAAAVKSVTDKINAIGKVAYDTASKAKIDEARKAYDALTPAQKAQIPANIVKILTDAETSYKAAADEATKVEYFAKFSVKSVPLKVKQSSTALAKDIQIAKGDKIVEWKSSNSKVVTVNKKTGKIKGKKVGKATITATTQSGKKASITVKVQKKAVASKKVTLTNKATNKAIKAKSTVTLKKGKKMTVVANVAPMTCAQKVKFTSSNKKVAKVSSKGVITAKKAGKATITAKVGKKTFKFTVKVTK